jgi:AraC-like DNA-binding protein
LETIARRCGFEHVESMCRMVKRTTGRTPGEFRKAKVLK